MDTFVPVSSPDHFAVRFTEPVAEFTFDAVRNSWKKCDEKVEFWLKLATKENGNRFNIEVLTGCEDQACSELAKKTLNRVVLHTSQKIKG